MYLDNRRLLCFWVISVVPSAAVSRHSSTRVILSRFHRQAETRQDKTRQTVLSCPVRDRVGGVNWVLMLQNTSSGRYNFCAAVVLSSIAY